MLKRMRINGKEGGKGTYVFDPAAHRVLLLFHQIPLHPLDRLDNLLSPLRTHLITLDQVFHQLFISLAPFILDFRPSGSSPPICHVAVYLVTLHFGLLGYDGFLYCCWVGVGEILEEPEAKMIRGVSRTRGGDDGR